MTTLTELAARLEAATGPSRELDLALARACGLTDKSVYDHISEQTIYMNHTQHFTESLDAAVALVEKVLPRDRWEVSKLTGYAAVIVTINGTFISYDYKSTPALALCLALVRDLISKEKP